MSSNHEKHKEFPQDLRTALESLLPHDHLCLIYESHDEWENAVIPFIAIGLKKKEKCVYIIDTHTATEICKHLEREGVDTKKAEASGHFTILKGTQAYIKEGSFDPDRTIKLLISETEKAISEGYQALRVTGEMTWMLKGLPGSEKILEYEAKLNRDFFPKYPCLTMCQYERWKFESEIIKGVLMTNPLLIRNNCVYRNFYYIPPEVFLNHECAVTEVQHWLNNLTREQQLQTEQKLAKESLHRAEQNFHRSLDDSPMGIRIVTMTGETLYANRAILDIYGYDSIEELKTTPVKKRYTPESYAEYLIRKEKRYKNEHEPYEYEVSIVRKDGEVRHLQVFRKEILWNGEKQFQVIYQDITEKKLVAKALKESEKKYRSIFENAMEGIFQSTTDGRFLTVNPAFAKMHGYDSPEELMQSVNDIRKQLYADPICREKFVRILHEQGVITNFEHQQFRKDGSIIWVRVNAREVRDDNNNVLYYEGKMEDISEQKYAEEKLQKSLQEKEILLQEIHHRVKNNLQVVCSILDLQSEYIDEQKTRDVLQETQNRVRAMALVHEKLYHLHDAPSILVDKYIESIVQYLHETYEGFAWNINIKVNVESLTVPIDIATACGLIVSELVSNAMKYAFPDKKAGEITIRFYKDKDSFVISVADNGIGLPPKIDIEKTGTLGLRLVKMLTRQLKGTMEWDKTKGTKWTITF